MGCSSGHARLAIGAPARGAPGAASIATLALLLVLGCGRSGYGPALDAGVGGRDATVERDTDGALDEVGGDVLRDVDAPEDAPADSPVELDGGAHVLERYAWALGGGGAESARATDVATDAAGNVYAVGFFLGDVDFGGGALPSAGGGDVFVVSFTSEGGLRWQRAFGGPNADLAFGIAVDEGGDSTVVGYFRDTIDFGGGPLTAAGGPDSFVVALDSDGGLRWQRAFGRSGQDIAYDVALDAAGNAVVTGVMPGGVDYGGGPLPSHGGWDAFVVSLTPDGVHRWSRGFGGVVSDSGKGVAASADGSVYVAGYFGGTVDFGAGEVVARGAEDAFVVGLGPDGATRWQRRIGGLSLDRATAVAADDAGHVYVAGTFLRTVDFWDGTYTSAGAEDVFVAALDADGAMRWDRVAGSAGADEPVGLAIDLEGGVRVAGYGAGPLDFGGGPVHGAGGEDLFVAAFDAEGWLLTSRGFGGVLEDRGGGVVVDGAGATLLAGYFADAIDFGGGALASTGGDDPFVLKLE